MAIADAIRRSVTERWAFDTDTIPLLNQYVGESAVWARSLGRPRRDIVAHAQLVLERPWLFYGPGSPKRLALLHAAATFLEQLGLDRPTSLASRQRITATARRHGVSPAPSNKR